jgi:3-dehydroquinate dehydratase
MASYFCNDIDWAPRKIEEKKPTRTKDPIEHPAHYTQGSVEVWDAIEAWKLGYLEGNIVKYVARAKYKGDELSDLRKARQYLNRAIEKLEASK